MEFVNPIRDTRRRVLHLTIEQLCNQAQVSKTLVIKNEQGTYPVPSETIMDFFASKVPDFDSEDFKHKYRRFQQITRRSNFGVLEPIFPLTAYLSGLPVGAVGIRKDEPYYHPLEFWRSISNGYPNLTLISKSFCVHQGILHKFENEHHLVNSVPKPLHDALIEAGYTPGTLNDLQLAYNEYKQYIRNLNIRANSSVS